MWLYRRLVSYTFAEGDTPQQREMKSMYVTTLLVGTAVCIVTRIYQSVRSPSTQLASLGLGIALVALVASLVQVFVSRRPAVGAFTVVISIGILIVDMGQAAVVDALRFWPLLVIVMDMRLVMECSSRVSTLMVGAVLVHLFVVASDLIFQYGLLDWFTTTDERLAYVTCDSPPCAKGIALGTVELLFYSFVFLVDFLATRHFAMSSLQEQKRMAAAVDTAEKIAQALADFDLEGAVTANDGDLLPSGLRAAFGLLVSNLAMYKPYLPDSCLPEMLRSEDGSDDVESDGETSTGRNCVSVEQMSRASSQPTLPQMAVGTTSALQDHNITLLVCNLVDFLGAESVVSVHTQLINTIGSIVRSHRGLIDGFMGDRVAASFNGAKPCMQHAGAAVKSAVRFTDLWPTDGTVPATSIGVATGKAQCGVLGNESMRRFGVVGRVGCWVHVVERWASQRGMSVVCTGRTYADVSTHIQGRLLLETLEMKGKKATLWEIMNVREHVEMEWMYQLEQTRQVDTWDVFNSAVGLVHNGELAAARRLLEGCEMGEMHGEYTVLLEMVCEALQRDTPLNCALQVAEVGVRVDTMPDFHVL